MTTKSVLPGNTCVLREIRAAYPNLIDPAPDLNGNDKYSVVLLIPKNYPLDEIKVALNHAIDRGKKKKWGGSVPANLHVPLQDGDAYADAEPDKPREFYRGNYYINAKQDPEWGKPTVLDINGLESSMPSTINSGDYVSAVVEFYPYKQPAGAGISATPKCIRKIRDGEPIGGGVSKAAALAALGLTGLVDKESDNNSDPLAGLL